MMMPVFFQIIHLLGVGLSKLVRRRALRGLARAIPWAMVVAILLLGTQGASADGWHRSLDFAGYQAGQRTRDGGLVAVGSGSEVVKLDATGEVEWRTRYSGLRSHVRL